MSAQFNDSFSIFTHQFAAAASRANRLALENAESVFGVQLRVFEKNIDATTAFLDEVAGTRDLDGYKTLWPKGLQVAKDNTERLVAASQEVFGLTLKAGEAFGQLAKSQIESASETVQANVAKAAKSVKTK
ncbi:phasin family protein [Pseudoxanthomonas mexicana]|uniref:phasin family protein n=1 Tax=Pseudoxanthomonas mexicana TaxID=128785 RepID=UPI00398AA763